MNPSNDTAGSGGRRSWTWPQVFQGALSPALRASSVVAAALLVVVAAGRAVAHRADLSAIGHITGVWVALGRYCNEGVFYPPLEADGYFAGTRYMPVLFSLIAGLARAAGDYLVAAKLAALVSVALLLGVVLAAARRITGRWGDALALAGLVVAFPEGLSELLAPNADALAAALGVWGLLVIDGDRPGRWRAWAAAALFILALGTKFSSVAAPAAAAVVLFRAGRRQAVGFAAACGVLGLVGLLSVQWLSDARFLDNLRSLGSGGMSFESIRIGPARVAFALRLTPWLGLVLPLALLTSFWNYRTGRFGLWDWYLLFTAATVYVIFTSPGTGVNHLLELEVAAVLVLARALAPWPAGGPAYREPLVRAAVLAVLLAGLYGATLPWCEPQADAISPRAVAEALPPNPRLLAEDATIPVVLGQRPVVMDPFSFQVLAGRGRVDDSGLVRSIRRHEFGAMVLLGRIDRPGESLCPRFHFGPRVTRAIQEAYRFDRRAGNYFVFVPNEGGVARAAGR
jgi:hypothetical protein